MTVNHTTQPLPDETVSEWLIRLGATKTRLIRLTLPVPRRRSRRGKYPGLTALGVLYEAPIGPPPPGSPAAMYPEKYPQNKTKQAVYILADVQPLLSVTKRISKPDLGEKGVFWRLSDDADWYISCYSVDTTPNLPYGHFAILEKYVPPPFLPATTRLDDHEAKKRYRVQATVTYLPEDQ